MTERRRGPYTEFLCALFCLVEIDFAKDKKTIMYNGHFFDICLCMNFDIGVFLLRVSTPFGPLQMKPTLSI